MNVIIISCFAFFSFYVLYAEATKAEDAPSRDSALEAMDPERRDWLERVLKDMSVDVFQELGKCITALSDEAVVADRRAEDLSLQLHAFDCVEDWVGQIDMANNFQRLGGFEALRGCLSSPHDELAAGACRVVAELAQNNPYCQEKLLEDGFLPALLQCARCLGEGEQPSPGRATKSLSAVSCLVRGYEPARQQLKEGDGLSTVVRLLQQSPPSPGGRRLRAKAAFFLAALISEEDAEVSAALCKLGLPELLVALLNEDEEEESCSNWREQVVAALLALSRTSKDAVSACKSLNADVQAIISRRLKAVQGKEEFQEEEEHYKNLLKIYGPENEPDLDR